MKSLKRLGNHAACEALSRLGYNKELSLVASNSERVRMLLFPLGRKQRWLPISAEQVSFLEKAVIPLALLTSAIIANNIPIILFLGTLIITSCIMGVGAAYCTHFLNTNENALRLTLGQRYVEQINDMALKNAVSIADHATASFSFTALQTKATEIVTQLASVQPSLDSVLPIPGVANIVIEYFDADMLIKTQKFLKEVQETFNIRL